MSVKLTQISIHGFRTIRALEAFKPRQINVLIGANGAGKSNFVSFFRLLSWMMSGGLQQHVAALGYANSLLHDGAEVTREITAELRFETEQGNNDYFFRLFHAAGDTLLFADERYRYSSFDIGGKAPWMELTAGHREARLPENAERGDTTARTIRGLLQKCIVHQFHNTSANARVRSRWKQHDNRWLKEDGANLAPFLLRLREEEPEYYHRIAESVRTVLPFFADFVLEPDKSETLLLQWAERGSDMVFSASQASDGMLRTILLMALLAQPEQDLPAVLILDEPELGMHPYAISIVAGLIRSASVYSQVIVATQSTALVDQFEPEDVIVVDREERESIFRRQSAQELSEWLQEYSLAELWEKNVLGGRPA